MVAFQLQQAAISQQVSNQLSRSSDTELCIVTVPNTSASELTWQGQSEFIYKGRRYDVAYAESKNNITTYHCINDTKEEELFSFFDEWLQKNLEKNTQSGKTSGSMFYFLSIVSSGNTPVVVTPVTRLTQLHYTYVYHYTAPVHSSLTPPPWCSILNA